ncbi:hypothetical protein CQ10_40155 [Bradyrhizobium valentinum]|nr:hypothetical protein CQ10_40155 [Bradyrhizobium valentinum]
MMLIVSAIDDGGTRGFFRSNCYEIPFGSSPLGARLWFIRVTSSLSDEICKYATACREMVVHRPISSVAVPAYDRRHDCTMILA